MREILFRGKVVNTNDDELIGKWILGQLVVRRDHDEGNEKTFICESGYKFIRCLNKMIRTYEVDPDTVGQFTGMTDKNGKRIFEGDIIKTHYANTPKADFIEQVVFHNGRFTGMYENSKMKMWAGLPDKEFKRLPQDKSVYMEWCEVIGNIHDNPELIQEVE